MTARQTTRVRVIRTLRRTELPWLPKKTYRRGRILHRYLGATYGVVTRNGIAVSEHPSGMPFFEVPKDAVEVADPGSES